MSKWCVRKNAHTNTRCKVQHMFHMLIGKHKSLTAKKKKKKFRDSKRSTQTNFAGVNRLKTHSRLFSVVALVSFPWL